MQNTPLIGAAYPETGCLNGSDGRFGFAGRARRLALMAFGFFSLVLGLIGAVLPLVPSTVFLLIAAWCFTRSSPRFADKLYGHKRFGPALCRWRDARIVPLPAKLLAAVSISASLVFLHGVDGQTVAVKWAVTAVCLAVIAFLLSRPHRLRVDETAAAAATAE